MADTDVTVIIVTWNTSRLIEACLESIAGALGELKGEVMVVDNASADGTADIVRRIAGRMSGLQVIEPGANLGFAAANNLAIAQATGEYLLLLNPDTELTPRAIETLVDCARQHQAAIVGARHRNPDGSLQPSVRQLPTFGVLALHLLKLHRLLPNLGYLRRYYARGFAYGRTQPAEQVAGSCLLVSRAALSRLGTLDERFGLWFEEVDLCRRALDESLPVWYCAQAEVLHHGAASFRQLDGVSRQRRFNRSLLAYARKHLGVGAWLLLAALHPVSLALAALATVLTRN